MGMIIEEDFSDIVSYAIAMSEPYSDRAHSFDFCYLYFRQPKEKILGNIEESCYALWSFLSSWGTHEFNIDGIFAPVYSRRDISVDTYKQQCDIVPHLIEYRYSRDLSKKECHNLYFAGLDALVKLGAKRLATYSLLCSK